MSRGTDSTKRIGAHAHAIVVAIDIAISTSVAAAALIALVSFCTRSRDARCAARDVAQTALARQ
jgi:hypothetical protein